MRQRWHLIGWRGRLAVVLLAGLALRGLAIEGCIRPIRVDGGSMAPTLSGASYDVECVDCGFEYLVGAEYLPASRHSTCPNCGFERAPIAPRPARSGTPVWIDRWPAWWKRLRRFDIVAVENPDGTRSVKRLIGFPGEVIEFRDGDLVVDSRPVSKSLSRFRQMAILVSDGEHVPQLLGSPRRWIAQQGPESAWRQCDGTWFCDAGVVERDSPAAGDWLEYRHRPSVGGRIPGRRRGDELPVFDTYAYNGETPRGTHHLVSDLVLDVDVGWGPRASIAFRLQGTGVRWRADVSRTAGHVTWRRDGRLVARHTIDSLRGKRRSRQRITFGLLDGRLLLAIDDRVVATQAIDDARRLRGHTRPVALCVTAGRVTASRLRLWRDLYYFGADPAATTWRFGPVERHLLVGDNVPMSIDQRLRPFRSWRPLGRVLD